MVIFGHFVPFFIFYFIALIQNIMDMIEKG